jgi:hypothetical protein
MQPPRLVENQVRPSDEQPCQSLRSLMESWETESKGPPWAKGLCRDRPVIEEDLSTAARFTPALLFLFRIAGAMLPISTK